MRKISVRSAAAVAALACLTWGAASVAQAPLPPQPHGALPGSPPPGMQHPPLPPPRPQGPLQRPFVPGGQRPPGPFPLPPAGAPANAEHGSAPHESASHAPEHCPGHGPLDADYHINWWHGLLSANSEKAEQPGFLNKLLFRYKNENDACDPKNEPPPFLASVLNFALLAFIVVRFGRKPLAEALTKRKQTIMHDIDNSSRLRLEAEARLKEYKSKFSRLAETREQIMAEYAAQAEAEKHRVLAEAEERRARMKRDAEFRIQQDRKTARAELLQYAVTGALSAAEGLIAKRLTPQDSERLGLDFVEGLSRELTSAKGASPGSNPR